MNGGWQVHVQPGVLQELVRGGAPVREILKHGQQEVCEALGLWGQADHNSFDF